MRVSVPANWQQVEAGSNSVTYAPQGAYFRGTTAAARSRTAIEVGVRAGHGRSESRHQLAASQLRAVEPAAAAVGQREERERRGAIGRHRPARECLRGHRSAGIHLAVDDRSSATAACSTSSASRRGPKRGQRHTAFEEGSTEYPGLGPLDAVLDPVPNLQLPTPRSSAGRLGSRCCTSLGTTGQARPEREELSMRFLIASRASSR